MGRRTTNLNKDTLKLICTLPAEAVLACLVGALSVWIFSNNSKSLNEIVSGLLAIEPLIKYYTFMAIPYLIVILIKYGVLFRSDTSKKIFNHIHQIIAEVGIGIQAILRTGAGVAMGILVLPTEITYTDNAHQLTYSIMIGSILLVSGSISMARKEIANKIDRFTYNNPLILNMKKVRN